MCNSGGIKHCRRNCAVCCAAESAQILQAQIAPVMLIFTSWGKDKTPFYLVLLKLLTKELLWLFQIIQFLVYFNICLSCYRTSCPNYSLWRLGPTQYVLKRIRTRTSHLLRVDAVIELQVTRCCYWICFVDPIFSILNSLRQIDRLLGWM